MTIARVVGVPGRRLAQSLLLPTFKLLGSYTPIPETDIASDTLHLGDLASMSSDELLKLLEAHGQQFLQSFDTPVVLGKRRDAPQKPPGRGAKKTKVEETQEEEEVWEGIQSDSDSDDSEESGSEEDEADGEGDEDGTSLQSRVGGLFDISSQRMTTSRTRVTRASQTWLCFLKQAHPPRSRDS